VVVEVVGVSFEELLVGVANSLYSGIGAVVVVFVESCADDGDCLKSLFAVEIACDEFALSAERHVQGDSTLVEPVELSSEPFEGVGVKFC